MRGPHKHPPTLPLFQSPPLKTLSPWRPTGRDTLFSQRRPSAYSLLCYTLRTTHKSDTKMAFSDETKDRVNAAIGWVLL